MALDYLAKAESGAAPWASPGYAAALPARLAEQPVSGIFARAVRNSRGERWAVTRRKDDEYQVVNMSDKRHWSGSAAEVVAFMEGNDA